MCMVPVCLGPIVEAPHQTQRMYEFVKYHLADYDVICLQEVIGLLWSVKD